MAEVEFGDIAVADFYHFQFGVVAHVKASQWHLGCRETDELGISA